LAGRRAVSNLGLTACVGLQSRAGGRPLPAAGRPRL